jgi:hypothetical protein
MATYKGIKGVRVESLATDPTALGAAGAVWYNTSSPTALKYGVSSPGAWSSGTNFPTNLENGSAFGTATAAVAGTGYEGPPASPAYTTTTFEYDGTTWASPATTGHQGGSQGAAGTQTAGLMVGGYWSPASRDPVYINGETETYDGSTWTEVADLNTKRQGLKGTGTTTAAIMGGGATTTGPVTAVAGVNNTETWDGTSWAETNNLNTARTSGASLGTTCPAPTAVIAGGTSTTNVYDLTEKWDGTSWTELADLNTARGKPGGAGSDGTSGIVFGGEGPGAKDETEVWDGTSWAEAGDLATARWGNSGTGTGSAAISVGGTPPLTAITEEWNSPALVIKTVTIS